MLVTALIILISVWIAFEFFKYDLSRYYRKYKIGKIINKVRNTGVALCRRLTEIKSEN